MEYVILVNRTSKDLEATWDGKRYKLKPGDTPLPLAVAEAAKRQNPIMGTGADYYSMQYLVGIKEHHDDCSPIEQSKSVELFDSRDLHGDKPVAIVAGTAQAYRNVNRLKNEDGPLSTTGNISTGFAHNEASGSARIDLP